MTTITPGRATAAALTGEQEQAVGRRQGSLLLAANAGSGKTTVLVERFVRAVHEDGVAPSRILAITFTERAAAELRERVRRRLRELGDRAAARDAEGAFVSTIHGFCARLLRAHPLSAGVAPGFGVLDAGTTAELRDVAFERALASWLASDGALDLAAACGVDRLGATIMGVHDELRSRGATQPRLPGAMARHTLEPALGALEEAGRTLARELAGARTSRRVETALAQLERGAAAPLGERKLHRGAAALQTAAADAYEAARVRCCEAEADGLGLTALALVSSLLEAFADEFAAGKAQRGALDFDDLELSARDLLEGDGELRTRWAERFDLLMVDELQDTNPREMAILRALDRDNLFTVGDEFQSIYGFRHADVDIFRRRRRALGDVDGVRLLSRNFRTRPALLGAINATFAPLFGPDFVALEPGRDAGPGAGPLLELMLCDTAGWEDTAIGGVPGSGPLWRRAEAALLAARIEQLVAAGEADPGEIVVLLRYATAASIYEQALVARGVPVAPAPGGGFYAGQVVCDLAAYVRVLANPLDDEALYGVLASPLCGAGADTLAVLGLAARRLGRAPWELLEADELPGLGAAERGRLAALRARIAGEREVAAAGVGLAELLVRSGYRERGLGGPGAAAGLANLRKLLRLARDFEAREGRDLRAFADRLASGRLGAAREQDAELGDADAVRLMTIHAAKGLEFPVVCLADLGHGPPLGGPMILTDGERVGLRVPTLASTRVDTLAYAELRGERDPAALAEEQRIAYVAMTRARERLILSGAAHFARWPAASASSAAIAWLGPALVPDLRARVQGPPGVCELELGGAPLRLTLTGAEDWIGPAAPSRPTPQPVQMSLFDAEAVPPTPASAGSPVPSSPASAGSPVPPCPASAGPPRAAGARRRPDHRRRSATARLSTTPAAATATTCAGCWGSPRLPRRPAWGRARARRRGGRSSTPCSSGSTSGGRDRPPRPPCGRWPGRRSSPTPRSARSSSWSARSPPARCGRGWPRPSASCARRASG